MTARIEPVMASKTRRKRSDGDKALDMGLDKLKCKIVKLKE
jgi:hypothetical protein